MAAITNFCFLFAWMNMLSCKADTTYPSSANNKSLLWEVSGNGLQKPSYIFGTMHLLCPDQAQLSNNLKTIIKNCDAIYFEIDLSNLGEMMSAAMSGTMRGDTTLKGLYSQTEYSRLADFFKQHNMAMQFAMLNKMQPMLVSALVYETMLPCQQPDGMEMSIMDEAQQYHKQIKGLETASFQAHLIDKIPYSIQAKELLDDVDSADAYKLKMDTLMQLYKSGDLEKLLVYSAEDEFGDSEMQELLLNKRNANWAEQFLNISQNKSVLIAVGAGHLPSEKGLLNLLRKKGYVIRAIANN